MNYAERQHSLDAGYTREYRDWVATLAPEKRADLAAQGLDEPDASRRTSTRQGDEFILKITASPRNHPADSADTDPSASGSEQPSTAAADAVAGIFARVRAHSNPLMMLDAACVAFGLMGIEGVSETVLAERHGVTRAAFSKLAVQMAETFNLPPSRGMRSKKVRNACRQARLVHLARKDARISA